ncbi:hypothetical protein RE428_10790 [Marinobacter nanhaiticus D15-8W]|nr:hypothetical protein [Marinobacter nanhaiticus]BES70061.1 hypothetical protein RE428_10790 [Marinobacter nanhaiticus D15-8W]
MIDFPQIPLWRGFTALFHWTVTVDDSRVMGGSYSTAPVLADMQVMDAG